MLAPEVASSDRLLTQAFNQTLRLDSFARKSSSLQIGRLQEDPEWLAAVRGRVQMLGKAGSEWTQERPEIWGKVLLQFPDYASAFAGVAEMKAAGALNTRQEWIDVLEQTLMPQLGKAIAATDDAAAQLQTRMQSFRSIQPLLQKSIEEGWAELGAEEREMTAIATELAHLQDLVGSLERSISSTELSSGQSIVSTTVKTVYDVAVSATASFSFLTMAASVFTVGKTFYSIISTTNEIGETLERIGQLQLEASATAQAAAGTKMVLRLAYELELTFSQISNTLPQTAAVWRTQREKVKSAIQALQAGVDPSSYLDLVTVPTANANWQAINSLVQSMVTGNVEAGPPVELNPQKPLPTQLEDNRQGESCPSSY